MQINDSSNNLICPSLRFNFSSTPLFFATTTRSRVSRSANFLVSRKREKEKSGGGEKIRGTFLIPQSGPKWRERTAQTARSSAFVIWIRGNRKRWRSKLISNRVWKSIEGALSTIEFSVSALFRSCSDLSNNFLLDQPRISFVEEESRNERTFLFLTIIHWICLK